MMCWCIKSGLTLSEVLDMPDELLFAFWVAFAEAEGNTWDWDLGEWKRGTDG